MDMAVDTVGGNVDEWLCQFESVLTDQDWTALESLFLEDCHWRDLLAYTWHITTHSGRENVVTAIRETMHKPVTSFKCVGRPYLVPRGGRDEVLECLFEFRSDVG